MSADRPARVSRRTALTGLGAMLAAGCGRVAFMAANVPAAFGAYQRHSNISYGTDSQQRLDAYVRPKNSSNLAAALRAHGVPVTLKLYPKLLQGYTVAALRFLARSRAPT